MRVIAIGGTRYYVKFACGSQTDSEPWWGPANDLMGDLLMRALGVRERLRPALVRFTPAAFERLRTMSPPANRRLHPSVPLGYARSEWRNASEGRALWPTDPALQAEVVTQDFVLRWIGAGHDHVAKGFLNVDGFPVAIDLGGLDIDTVWQTTDPETRRLDRDYGGIAEQIRAAREARAKVAATARRMAGRAVEHAVFAVPAEWAEPVRRARMAKALAERLAWVLPWYET